MNYTNDFQKEMRDKVFECFYDIYEVIPEDYILEGIMKQLPTEISLLAIQWGWDDTEVRDKVYRFVRDKFKG